ncbi:MAG: hypothetical protein AB7G04_08875 [Hyphomonadaceae bacterium]
MRALLWAMLAWAAADGAPAQTLSGYWAGEYICAQGITGVTLDLREKKDGAVSAVVSFYAHPENAGVPSGCFTVAGAHDAGRRTMTLKQRQWIVRPDNYYMIDFDGALDAAGETYSGAVRFPVAPGLCTTFTMRRAVRPAPPEKDACRAAPIS